MLEYDDFYSRVWNDYISLLDVSHHYRTNNLEFIQHITFSAYRKYQTKNVHESVYAEMLKVFFTDLFIYRPEVVDSGDMIDWNIL
jgi:hypothetical protein